MGVVELLAHLFDLLLFTVITIKHINNDTVETLSSMCPPLSPKDEDQTGTNRGRKMIYMCISRKHRKTSVVLPRRGWRYSADYRVRYRESFCMFYLHTNLMKKIGR